MIWVLYFSKNEKVGATKIMNNMSQILRGGNSKKKCINVFVDDNRRSDCVGIMSSQLGTRCLLFSDNEMSVSKVTNT